MRDSPWSGPALFVAGLLAACASPILRPDDRAEACRIVVEEGFGHAALQPNSLSSGAGPLSGAGQGFVVGALAGGPLFFLTAPAGAVVGGAVGAACAAGSVQHPDAEAQLERWLRDADVHAVKRSLEEALEKPRPECRGAPREGHDAVLRIEKIEARMGCLLGRPQLQVAVTWRTVAMKDATVLNSTTTLRSHTSARDLDAWFSDPAEFRREIEVVFGDIGREIASQFVGE